MKITPVILSGGSGTRLWPVSRELNPKQFLDFFGQNSLFQKSILRVNSDSFSKPIVVCNNEHRFTVAEEMRKISVEPNSIILEPCGRNTAPAIAMAALAVMTNDKANDVILVMPSDHIILQEDKFIEHVKNSYQAAADGYLITFGIKPDKAETGYGYIKKSSKIDNFSEVFAVEKFIEKPDLETAQKFLTDGNYLWNSGIFMFRASAYLEALQKYHNDIFISCINAHNKARQDLDFTRVGVEDFEACKNISIDYAVMEKAQKVAVVPVSIGWSDVGSWQAVAESSAVDENGNSLLGDSFALKTKNSYINSRHGIVAAIGVENLVIISLKDVVLVLNKDNAQDVKKMFETLKQMKREECVNDPKVQRPWGSFEVIDISDRFKVKRITVKPGASLSLQMHNHRAEHWIVVRGTAHVTCDKDEFVLTEDKSTYIPIGKKHRLENKGKIPLELIEVQTGEYLGEDDIVRFSDIYGR